MRIENYNTETLKLATARSNEGVLAKFPALKQWIEGEKHPTLKQLMKLAATLNIPFGYFFLDKLPEKALPFPHYRTKKSSAFKPSPELLDTIEIIQKRQAWAKEKLIELGNEPLPFANSISVDSSIDEAVALLKDVLQIQEGWAADLPRWSDAFRELVTKSEKAGVFVVVNGVVGNNTHRELKVEEFRGFVIYDPISPFVFINGKDSISGKTFTLIHELVHILIGQSASFDFVKMQPANNKIEKFCDRVTAEFLVPRKELLSLFADTKDYQALAKHFKVSQIVIARRLLDLEVISKKEFFAFYNEYIEREFKKSGKGGDFYNTAPYRISKRFFELVDTSVRQSQLLHRDAFRLTGLKASTYDNLKDRLDQ